MAAAAIHLARGRLALVAAALLVAPLPAFLFLRLTNKPITGAPEEELSAGLALSALVCYLAPAVGALTTYLLEMAMSRRSSQPAEPDRRGIGPPL